MKITQINSYEFDERFYQQIINGEKKFAPSVTYILGCAYPNGYGLEHWRGDVGNKRADEILEETSTDGSFVHDAIEKILNGQKISGEDISGQFAPKRSLKIKRCLQSFLDWHEEFKPEVLSTEYIIWNKENNYAGTVDFKCKINDEIYIIDFKTSKSIHPQHKVQLSTYGHSENAEKVALLHLGNTTKKKYSFLVMKDEDREKYFNQFLQTLLLFRSLNPNAKPSDEVFPEYFKLNKQ